MSINPNTYDDGAYVEATLNLEGEIEDLVTEMWNAGGSPDDIRNELESATDSALLALTGPKIERRMKPKPKKK